MRFLRALRSRQQGYTSLAHPPTTSLELDTPRRQVERIPITESPVFSAPGTNGVNGHGNRTQAGASRLQPSISSSVVSVTEHQEVHHHEREFGQNQADDFESELFALHAFCSEPPPPPKLWDTDDIQYLDKVVCRCSVRLTQIDPKNGSFEGQMKCHWVLRELNTKERTEPRIRVPGIRFPRLISHVEESRIWRRFENDTPKSVSWVGTSVFSFSGIKIFDMHDFPFDRQIISLHLFEFVWRDAKDTDVFYETMKVVKLTMDTKSMQPEWDTYPAVIEPCDILKPGSGPTFSTRFIIKLRLQRRESYYVNHIFLVSLLILIASILPLALEPGNIHIGDRLYIHVGGLLSLVAFKFSVSSFLPSVPYATFISSFLQAQILTVVAVAIESVFSYRTVHVCIAKPTLDFFEDVILIALLMYWLGYFGYLALIKKRKSWEELFKESDGDIEPPHGYLVAPV